MIWSEDKILILEDEYAYADLGNLALKLGTTIKGVKRKAEKLKLKRATNNQVIDGYKYCSLCKTEHHISHFYRNKAKSNGYEYYCKKYYETKSENTKDIHQLPHLNKGGYATDYKRGYATDYKGHSSKRPRNPIVIKNNVEGKICNKCKVWKPLSQYWDDKNGIAQKKARCIECYKNTYTLSKKDRGF